MNRQKLRIQPKERTRLLQSAVAAVLAVISAVTFTLAPITLATVQVSADEQVTAWNTEAISSLSDEIRAATELARTIDTEAAVNAADATAADATAANVSVPNSDHGPLISLSARAGRSVRFPYPAGAMAVSLYKDGKRILSGQCAEIGGVIYVPVQRFADLFGSFKTTYEAATERVTISGKNLYITVKVGDPYITCNERIFYTGHNVLSLGGWIFVPLESMCRALDAELYIRRGYYEAYVTSGDPTSIPWASSYYNETDLYWLSRIISAESRGEPFRGQIAVGNVILNRVRSSQFPNTVKGVIFDNKYGTQFSPTANGTIYNTPTASAVMAAKICLEGYSLSTRMIYFYNPSIATSSWIGRTRPYIMTVGNHKFYA